MQYRYLKETGALNEMGAAPSVRAARATRPAEWRGRRVPNELLELVPESVIRDDLAIPIAADGKTLIVAVVDPENIALADKLSFITAREVRLVPASREEIVGFLDRHFGPASTRFGVDSLLQEFTPGPTRSAPSPRQARVAAGALHHPAAALPSTTSQGAVKARGGRGGLPDHATAWRAPEARPGTGSGLDPTHSDGDQGVLTYVVEEGQCVLLRRSNGTMDVVVGPRRLWRGRNAFRPMMHHVAHPGDYLIVRYRDGRQEHVAGPAEVWFDPRVHREVTCEEALQVAAKEAVVVYSQKEGTGSVQRRVEYGPTLFIPRPGEWLHTFSWHSSEGGSKGIRKVPNGLVFQKLWLMPDQMYHDVPDVRTADDAVLTIRLMLFFELLDITTMLDTTHDPIGDFVNAATSDVVDFTGRHDFESFKQNTDKLNELATYRQLSGRAAQCGYRINKVVYRGYGAPERLQQMHDQAIEARTRLQLERATEQQAQDLENFKLDSQMLRAGKRRGEQADEVDHELELGHRKQEAELRDREARMAFQRQHEQLGAELRQRLMTQEDAQQREHLAALRDLGVDLTAYLTQARADRVIEFRGQGGPGATHVHLDPSRENNGASASSH